MAFETRDNSGVLFPNTFKNADNQPDFRGQLLIGGVWFKLSAWNKAKGVISLAAQEMTEEDIRKMQEREAGRGQPRQERQAQSRGTDGF